MVSVSAVVAAAGKDVRKAGGAAVDADADAARPCTSSGDGMVEVDAAEEDATIGHSSKSNLWIPESTRGERTNLLGVGVEDVESAGDTEGRAIHLWSATQATAGSAATMASSNSNDTTRGAREWANGEEWDASVNTTQSPTPSCRGSNPHAGGGRVTAVAWDGTQTDVFKGDDPTSWRTNRQHKTTANTCCLVN